LSACTWYPAIWDKIPSPAQFHQLCLWSPLTAHSPSAQWSPPPTQQVISITQPMLSARCYLGRLTWGIVMSAAILGWGSCDVGLDSIFSILVHSMDSLHNMNFPIWIQYFSATCCLLWQHMASLTSNSSEMLSQIV
jgi:hypothetical protein